MSGETFSDSTMLEIFRAEVETHVESLTSGLLALERDPNDTKHLDEMMRGAHSIKGAARIVGIDPAVRVAHVMEDGFVAAKNGKLTLRPDHVDVLLRGVDLLNRIAIATKESVSDWGHFDGEAIPLVSEITSVLAGKPALPASAVASTEMHSNKGVSPPAVVEAPVAEVLTIPFPPLLDSASAEAVRCAFIAGLDANVSSIKFDLSATTDLDATGLALLAAVPAQRKDDRIHIELVGISADLKYLLDVTGVARLYSSGGF
jgi:two-component system sensor histidine kinase and response regulator WspE